MHRPNIVHLYNILILFLYIESCLFRATDILSLSLKLNIEIIVWMRMTKMKKEKKFTRTLTLSIEIRMYKNRNCGPNKNKNECISNLNGENVLLYIENPEFKRIESAK